MSKTAVFSKRSTRFLLAIGLVMAGVGAVTALTMAAVPDSNGQINACYKNSTKTLSITDPAGNCASNETALSWMQGQSNGPLASAKVIYDPDTQISSLDAANSKNIISFTDLPGTEGTCIQVNFTPKYFTSARQDNLSGVTTPVGIKQAGTWLGADGSVCDSVAGANIYISPPNLSYYAFIY